MQVVSLSRVHKELCCEQRSYIVTDSTDNGIYIM